MRVCVCSTNVHIYYVVYACVCACANVHMYYVVCACVCVCANVHIRYVVCACAIVLQIKRLKKENKDLRRTIADLRAGQHDIQLEGVSQRDMEDVLCHCNKLPQLAEKLKEQDPTDTLAAFWQEQVERSQATAPARKRWNPIVLRFMLDLWEKMGEKNFRVLEKEKVLFLPSKRHLVRQKRKVSPRTHTYIQLCLFANMLCLFACRSRNSVPVTRKYTSN